MNDMNFNRDRGLVSTIMSDAFDQAEAQQVKPGLLMDGPVTLECRIVECGRKFTGDKAMVHLRDHAEAVHTFDDIRRLLNEQIREEYGRRGDYNRDPIVPAVWTWIDDLSADWVVFVVEETNDSTLYKASYLIDDSNNVTLGTPEEVVRRTVYDPVKK